MINIKKVLHYYIGCEVKFNSGLTGKLININKYSVTISSPYPVANGEYNSDDFKLLLYPLQTITIKEMEQVNKIISNFDRNNSIEVIKGMAAVTQYLLQQKFDLFNLIDSNNALDKTRPINQPIYK